MNLSELELKKGTTTVIKADLSVAKLTIDITEELSLTIKDANGIIKISKVLSPNTSIMVSKKSYSCIKHL